jgi:hypothetical protein
MVPNTPTSSAQPNQQALLLAALTQANQAASQEGLQGGPTPQPSFNFPPSQPDQFTSLGIPAPGQGQPPSQPDPSLMMAPPPSPEQPQPGSMPALPAPASANLGAPQDPGMMAPPQPPQAPAGPEGFKLPLMRDIKFQNFFSKGDNIPIGKAVANPVTSALLTGLAWEVPLQIIHLGVEAYNQKKWFALPESKALWGGLAAAGIALTAIPEYLATKQANAKYGPLLPVLGPQTPKGQADAFMAGQAPAAPPATA